ncbi:MAG: hypothetical protein JSV04_00260 [Candidatus Heimdallarchaeota archaeon]|nr:MAG: hypothetical protein JSV04_00260 [Candidatus Heimdallarchaeota archaeon]
MYYSKKRLKVAFLTTMSLVIFCVAFNQPVTYSCASTMDVKGINTIYPRLFVTKVADKSEVVIGDTIVITVLIENFGNQTAYNVTFIDQPNNPWIFEVSGLTQLSYGQIAPNETRQFNYLVTTKSLGTHYLHAARIDYYNSEVNPTKFVTVSNEVEITVIEPPEDFSLANFNAAITLLIILIILDVLLFLRLLAPKINQRPKED